MLFLSTRSEDQVRKLIAGPEGVFICDECIGYLLRDYGRGTGRLRPGQMIYDTDINLLKPEEIHKIPG